MRKSSVKSVYALVIKLGAEVGLYAGQRRNRTQDVYSRVTYALRTTLVIPALSAAPKPQITLYTRHFSTVSTGPIITTISLIN